MKFFYLLLLLACQSCFLFPKFRKDNISFTENGLQKNYRVVVPKGYNKKEKLTGPTGNEEMYYHYPGGALLYFARVTDTAIQYQPLNYELNMPKELYHALFYKGIDSTNQYYWRENRINHYKIGYTRAAAGDDWRFDSSLNYFSRHFPLDSIQLSQ